MNSIQIPHTWELTTIGKSFEFTEKKRSKSIIGEQTTLAFIPMEYIPIGRVRVSSYEKRSRAAISSGTYIENGDLIVAKITPSFENGKQAIVDIDQHSAYATTEVIPIHGIEDVSITEYLYFYLLLSEVRNALAGKMEGSTGRQRLAKATLSETSIALPPLPEQRRIAHVLSTVQEAIAQQDKLIRTTTELKQALMHKLFTEGLRGEPLKETEIGMVPESWEVVALREIAQKPQYGVTASSKPHGNVQFLRITDITEEGVDWTTVPWCEATKNEIEACKLEKGDILFARIGATTGKSFVIKDPPLAVFASYLIRIRVKPVVDANYLSFFFQTEAYWSQVNANKHSNLKMGVNGSVLASLKIPLPSRIDEQKQIAGALLAVESSINSARSKHRALQDLFRTLLQELMAGRVRVA